ncbi:MAG: serine hydrolase domain-containing protein [Myxococcota bacterium]
MKEIDEIIIKAIEGRVFPSASLLIFRGEEIVYRNFYGRYSYSDNRAVSEESLYDVASLTKPLITSLSIALLVQNREIRFDSELSHFFNEYKKPEKLGITIRDMLTHRSGLIAHREYFKMVPEERWGERLARDIILKEALNEPLFNRGKTLYSDIDFMILGYLIELIASTNLRDFVIDNILRPLNINNSDFCGNRNYRREELMIPVSNEFIGVDDENSRAMGGIAGHSGLFSNVDDIYKLLVEIFHSYNDMDWRLFKPWTIKSLLTRSNDFQPSMFRGGFDTPLREGSQYGENHSDETVGHLGFTGTSFVIDLKAGVGVILLTNRVCPDRNNFRIKDFRREFHNKIFNILNKKREF